MRPYIAILAAFVALFSVALRGAQIDGTPSSITTIANGSSIGSSRALPLSLPRPRVLAARAVGSKACRAPHKGKPKKPRRDLSDRALDQAARRLSKRTLRTPANYQGNPGEFVLAEYERTLHLQYMDGSESMGEFFKLENQRLDAAVGGLSGCTAVIVVSRVGMWLAHFWEEPSFREYETVYGDWDDEADDRGWDDELDMSRRRTEADRATFSEEVLLPMQLGGPAIPGLMQYIHPGGPFHHSQRVKFAIITPGLDGTYEYGPEVQEIRAVMNTLFPGAFSVVIDYERKNDAHSQDLNAAGPCNVGQGAVYKVWFEDRYVPILTDQWPAFPQQIIERPEDYHPRRRRNNVNACASSKPPPPPPPPPPLQPIVVVE